MAISRVTTWNAGDTLTAAALNGEFNNIIDNALSLISPLTGTLDAGNNPIINIGAAGTDFSATGGLTLADVLSIQAEDARTNTVDVGLTVRSTTTGTPAAGIGTGILVQAESADEAPSDVGQLEFSLSDVTAASEDSRMDILLRIAGAALASAYRFQATAGFRGIFTHANTADRTYTLPDKDGTIATTADAGGLQSVQVFTASGTWTKPAGINTIVVEVVGGGGGGGGANGTGAVAGGGGGGGYSRELVSAPGASETVTVGGGGSGGVGANAGSAGGSSSLGSLLSATGGSGGSGASGTVQGLGGAGGSGSGGSFGIKGDAGAAGNESNGSITGGNGGSSHLGGGGLSAPANATGGAGGNYGGGGAGAANNSSSNITGGAGAGGIVIVWEYV